MSKDFTWSTGSEIAAAVAAGETSALAVTDAALAVIAARNPTLNAFTAVTGERARAKAKAVDASSDKSKLPLAGVPFAVKICSTSKASPPLPARRSIARIRRPNATPN